MQFHSWWARTKGRLLREAALVRRAIVRQKHDDQRVLDTWGSASEEERAQAYTDMEGMLERSTGSINNSYLKVQISTGLSIGLIAVVLSVFSPMPDVNKGLLVMGTLMMAASVGLSLLVTTPRTTAWKQVVREPGVYAIMTAEKRYLSLSRRVLHNRVVLLGNRRIAWLCTWLLTLPGLALVMIAWQPLVSSLGCMAIGMVAAIYRKLIGGRPVGSYEYPRM